MLKQPTTQEVLVVNTANTTVSGRAQLLQDTECAKAMTTLGNVAGALVRDGVHMPEIARIEHDADLRRKVVAIVGHADETCPVVQMVKRHCPKCGLRVEAIGYQLDDPKLRFICILPHSDTCKFTGDACEAVDHLHCQYCGKRIKQRRNWRDAMMAEEHDLPRDDDGGSSFGCCANGDPDFDDPYHREHLPESSDKSGRQASVRAVATEQPRHTISPREWLGQ